MLQEIPVSNKQNQSFQTTVAINNANVTLGVVLRFNEVAGYWSMTLSNPTTNTVILDSIPLFADIYPAGNLLGQYEYLNIGEWYLVNVSGTTVDIPNSTNLGTSYILLVGDNKTAAISTLATTPTTPIPSTP